MTLRRKYRRTRRTVKVGVVFATLGLALLLSGCDLGENKYSEPWNDAPRGRMWEGSAEIIVMPDGFGNAATKCGPGQMRYTTLYHFDGPYGSVSVVHDPTCPK